MSKIWSCTNRGWWNNLNSIISMLNSKTLHLQILEEPLDIRTIVLVAHSAINSIRSIKNMENFKFFSIRLAQISCDPSNYISRDCMNSEHED